MQHTTARAIAVAKKDELRRLLESNTEQNEATHRDFLAQDEHWQAIKKVGCDNRLTTAVAKLDEAQKAFDISVEKKHVLKRKEEEAKKEIKEILKRK